MATRLRRFGGVSALRLRVRTSVRLRVREPFRGGWCCLSFTLWFRRGPCSNPGGGAFPWRESSPTWRGREWWSSSTWRGHALLTGLPPPPFFSWRLSLPFDASSRSVGAAPWFAVSLKLRNFASAFWPPAGPGSSFWAGGHSSPLSLEGSVCACLGPFSCLSAPGRPGCFLLGPVDSPPLFGALYFLVPFKPR